MKQIPMTPQLSDMIHAAVGDDVDTANLAVFETIALNNVPLPGKNGSIFEGAVVAPVTLSQMVDYVNAPNPLPLVSDHDLSGAPKGKVFHAGLDYNDEGNFEYRELFYVDPTEEASISKLNSGTLDEVSVSFLSSAMLCSECQWDYMGPEASFENVYDRTCGNGHTVGTDGVHVDLVGLSQFLETSLVALGAADKPKILGKSQSKLAPTNDTGFRLAAKGFELRDLVLEASIGKEDIMSDKLIADLMTATGTNATLTANLSTITIDRDAKVAELTAAKARVTELEAELATAKAAKPEDYETAKTESAAALSYFGEQFDHLVTASGKPKVEGEARPKTVADFKSKISEMTGNLTSILPVDGVSKSANDESGKDAKLAFDASAFTVRK